MSGRACILCGALAGASGVLLGAWSAHGLRGQLEERGLDAERTATLVENFETGVRYQLFHAPAVVLVGILLVRSDARLLKISAWFFLAGLALFSGLLYAWVLSGGTTRWMVHVVPLGGLALTAGWLLLGVGAWRDQRPRAA